MDYKDWNVFVVTGRVADYLNYKNKKQETDNGQTGADTHESDRSDRDGAGSGTHR